MTCPNTVLDKSGKRIVIDLITLLPWTLRYVVQFQFPDEGRGSSVYFMVATLHVVSLLLFLQNLRDLRELFPKERQDKLSLFSKWDPENTDKYDKRDVPDPYFCGSHANVVKLVEGGVEAIGKKLGLKLDE
eukprot:gb/GECG01013861.1/.p1 GENE.gb/GECG01013861.1/~~gb/GECG01013861.1/.p1  ORF type:complete len:131 (+),score=12.41 gb/GECG01013861.1/:1-393(+)